jgi:hypothetical protein
MPEAPISERPGGLLHHHFTLTEISGMFLWPDPAGCPTPGVTRHHALWSTDFPRNDPARLSHFRDHPAGLGEYMILYQIQPCQTIKNSPAGVLIENLLFEGRFQSNVRGYRDSIIHAAFLKLLQV